MRFKSTTSFASDLLGGDSTGNDADVETETETDAPETTPPESGETLSKDTVFELLKNQRRRDALAFLKREEGSTTLSDMAEFIAAKENGIEIQQLSSSQRKRVYIGLYQCHLPKMASAGIIDFDKNRGTVELLPASEQLSPFLDDEPRESTSARTAITAAVSVAAATTAGVLNLPLFALVPDAGWAVISATAFVAFAVAEAYRSST